MLTTMEAIYEDGKVLFNEPPPVMERTKVIVTFLEEEKEKPKKSHRAFEAVVGM